MLLEDEKLAKVDNDAATPLSPAPQMQKKQSSQLSDTEMKEADTSKPAKSQQDKPLPSKPNKTQPTKTPVANPSVASSSSSSSNGSSGQKDDDHKRNGSGFLNKLFHKKHKQPDHDLNGVMEPKRLKYQLPNSKGEKFELYTWLKPTK